MSLQQSQQRFLIRQKTTLMANQYVVTVARPDGSEGEVVAFAQQKRMTLKEQVNIYTDESKDRVLCSFEARQVLDVRDDRLPTGCRTVAGQAPVEAFGGSVR
ncbi:hypothetical protein GCM10023080_091720 [Streptomyces pseudoechinosporeus]